MGIVKKKSKVTTKFFTFNQNNSGGVFDGPAMYVIVEAINAKHADQVAEQYGVYFNGCESGTDCHCCGDRWSRTWDEKGDDVPTIYGKAVEASKVDSLRASWSKRFHPSGSSVSCRTWLDLNLVTFI